MFRRMGVMAVEAHSLDYRLVPELGFELRFGVA